MSADPPPVSTGLRRRFASPRPARYFRRPPARRGLFTGVILAFLLSFTAGGSVRAADPLQLIPKDISGVVRLQAPQKTSEDLGDFVDQIQPGMGGMVEAQVGLLGAVISNPALAGVDQTQDWYVAFSANTRTEPHVLMLIPTTNPQELKDAVGPRFNYAETQGWTAWSESPDLIERVNACLDDSSVSLAEEFDQRHDTLLSSGHLSLYVNIDGLKETYAAQLSGADQQLDQAIDMIASQVESAGTGVDMEHVWELYRDLGRGALQLVRDSSALTVTVSIEDEALQIEELLTVSQGSPSDTVFSGQPADDLSLLQSLPEGQTGYMAMHGMPELLLSWSSRMMTGMIPDEDVQQRMQKSLAIIGEAKSATIAMGGDILPEADAAMQYFAISRFDPASTVPDAIAALGDLLEYEVAGIRQSMKFERDAEEIDGHSVHLYQVDQEIPEGLDPLGVQQAINDRLYGEDGITQRIVYRGDTVLQTLGGGSDGMKQLINAPQWSDESLLAARKRFPERACFLVLADLPGFVINMGRLMVESGGLPLPVDADSLADLEVPRSYAGVSITVEPEQLHARTVVPVGTFQAVARIVAFAQQAAR